MNAIDLKQFEEALNECAAEPIHRIGHVQPHGALLTLSSDKPHIVLQASANLAEFIDVSPQFAIGYSLIETIGQTATEQVSRLIEIARIKKTTMGIVKISGRSSVTSDLLAHVYVSDDLFVLELERDEVSCHMDHLAEFFLKMELSLLDVDPGIQATVYFDQLAKLTRILTGYDSIMVLRFDQHWNGEVIAQDRSEKTLSFLGQHFPASDIPLQARILYTKNLVRIVADIDALPVPVLPGLNPLTGQALDMTYSSIRSLSPIHIEYLRNMGIKSSMSISLLQNGRLWGLIVCHNLTPKRVSFAMQDAATFIGRTASMKLALIEAIEHRELIGLALKINADLIQSISQDSEVILMQKLMPQLQDLLNATGIIMIIESKLYFHGDIPDAKRTDELLQWIKNQASQEVFSCDYLAQVLPPANLYPEIVSGLIATPSFDGMKNAIIWLRKEKTGCIQWAGKYEDGIVRNAAGNYRLTPRKSFEIWTESWRGHSEPWKQIETGIVALLSKSMTEGLMQKNKLENNLLRQKESYLDLLIIANTKHKAYEEEVKKLSLAVEQSPNPILITDTTGIIEYINDAFTKTTGYSREEAIGRNARFIKSGKTPKATYSRLWKNLLQGESWQGTFINKRKDGSEYLESALISPIRQSNGEISHYLGIKQDITERNKLETDLAQAREAELILRQAKANAEALAQSKAEFLASMSHEIRTPMNAVLGFTQTLQEESLSDTAREMVNHIQTAGESLLAIINDILDFSKIEAGRVSIERLPFQLDEVLRRIRILLSGHAQTNGLVLQIQDDTAVSGSLNGDALRLEQILINLIGNAIKFTDTGTIMVRVSTIRRAEDEVRLRFEISDSGIGMSPQQVNQLFSPYSQADGSITRRFGGTGLGLTICKRLVELMDGQIGVSSIQEQGSTFWFELPFGMILEPVRTEIVLAPSVQTLVLAGMRIMVVDDVQLNRFLAEKTLSKRGANVVLAEDGLQAVKLLRASPEDFDMVLMDIQMPVMDGLEATRIIRQELKLNSLPVIALTAGVMEEEKEKAKNAGLNDFISKPIDLNRLTEMVLKHRKT